MGPNITASLTGQFILLCWATFLIFWLVTSFSTKPVRESQRWQWNNTAIRFLAGLGVILLSVGFLHSFTGFRLWPHTTLVGVIGDIVAALGLALMLWARVTLGGNWSANVVLKEGHELIDYGPYAYVRHPIYSGLLLLVLGEVIWFGTVGWVLVWIGFLLGFGLKARQEELLLTRHFPQAYPSYRKRVNALIPYIL